jgi:hypothetical protein
MEGDVLKLVLEEATALTASLPESVRQVAFSKAFDVLLEEQGTALHGARPRARSRFQGRSRSGGRAGTSRPRAVGPKLALSQLVESGYFTSSRGLPEIQACLRDSLGREYGSNELSISLLRLVRDGRLSRQRNVAGQYEYWAAGHKDHAVPAQALRHSKNTRLLSDGRER